MRRENIRHEWLITLTFNDNHDINASNCTTIKYEILWVMIGLKYVNTYTSSIIWFHLC